MAVSALLAIVALVLACALAGVNFAGLRWRPARLPLMLACLGLTFLSGMPGLCPYNVRTV